MTNAGGSTRFTQKTKPRRVITEISLTDTLLDRWYLCPQPSAS